MTPADQRLGADDFPRSDVEFWLVVQYQLISLYRMAQVLLNGLVFDRAGIHCRLEELKTIAPGMLGVIHGPIGSFQQRLCLRSVIRISGNADAGGDVQFMLANVVRQAQCFQNFRSGQGGVLCMPDLPQQHHELIASLTAYRVGAAHTGK